MKLFKNYIDIDKQNAGKPGYVTTNSFADPYVLRFNGKYYLYYTDHGVKTFISDDLINWDYVGVCLTPDDTNPAFKSCYAPEVIYYKGQFIMCTSPSGTGHRFYKSESPTGPFLPLTDKILKGIDGSFYVDDDGELLFMHTVATGTGQDGLTYNVLSNFDIPEDGDKTPIKDAFLNGWTEGPSLLRRGDYHYLTYTGNHFLSIGYRICYSYSKCEKPDLETFIQPDRNTTLICTENDYCGIGHSSNVTAPNLDGIYTAYHTLYGKGGPDRRYNVTQYLTNGAILTANGLCKYDTPYPTRPDFETDGKDLDLTEDGLLTNNVKTKKAFTAEFNFIPKNGYGEVIVSCCDEEDSYHKIVLNGTSLKMIKVANGKDQLLSEASLPENEIIDALRTIRVENGYGKCYVYVDGMRKIKLPYSLPAGFIGYGKACTPQYTAFSNDVFGTGDFNSIKNLPSRFPAICHKKGFGKAYSIKNAKPDEQGVRQGEEENTVKTENFYGLLLDTEEDFISYDINVEKTAMYSLNAYLGEESKGATIAVFANGVRHEFTIGNFNTESGYASVHIGDLPLKQGISTMAIQLLKGKLNAVSWEFVKDAVYPESLGVLPLCEAEPIFGNVLIGGGNLFGNGDANVALFGSEGMSDYSTSFKVFVHGEADGGIVVRARGYSNFFNQKRESLYSYFVRFTQEEIILEKTFYGSTELSRAPFTPSPNGNNVEISCIDNNVKVTVDGHKIFDVIDDNAYVCGRFGMLTFNDKISFKDFTCKKM